MNLEVDRERRLRKIRAYLTSSDTRLLLILLAFRNVLKRRLFKDRVPTENLAPGIIWYQSKLKEVFGVYRNYYNVRRQLMGMNKFGLLEDRYVERPRANPIAGRKRVTKVVYHEFSLKPAYLNDTADFIRELFHVDNKVDITEFVFNDLPNHKMINKIRERSLR